MGSSPVCNLMYGGDVIPMTYTTKVINMTWYQLFITHGGIKLSTVPNLLTCLCVMFITHRINMGECLVASYIIRTFVLSVVKSETGSTRGLSQRVYSNLLICLLKTKP
jgi:hypothetical protein